MLRTLETLRLWNSEEQKRKAAEAEEEERCREKLNRIAKISDTACIVAQGHVVWRNPFIIFGWYVKSSGSSICLSYGHETREGALDAALAKVAEGRNNASIEEVQG